MKLLLFDIDQTLINTGGAGLRALDRACNKLYGLEHAMLGISPHETVPANWPPGYQLTVTLPLTSGHSKKRPYVAVWVEDSSGKLVHLLAFWGSNSKYHATLSTAWELLRKNHVQ